PRLFFALAFAILASAWPSAYSSYASWTAHPVTVYVNPVHASPWLSPDQISQETQNALQDWNVQGGADFTFLFGGLTDSGALFDGKNVVVFAAEPSPDGYIAFTHAWWDAGNHLL